MQSSKMVWYIHRANWAFYLPVIYCIPPELLDIVFEASQFDGYEHILDENFSSRGYTVTSLLNANWKQYRFIVCDEEELEGVNRVNRFNDFISDKVAFCCLRHAVDRTGSFIPRASFSIRAHKRLAGARNAPSPCASAETGELFCKIQALPAAHKLEFAYTGPFHMGAWIKKRHLPLKERRQELEETLQRVLPKDKPVLAFFLDEFGDDKSLVHGLKQLSAHATIIYKEAAWKDSRLLALGKAVIPWGSAAYAPNILRFGADALVAGYYSGTFASSLMLGLRVIPFFTTQIFYKGRNSHEQSSYERFLPQSMNPDNTAQRGMLAFEHIFNIEDSQNIVETLHNAPFWEQYEQRLPDIQKFVFGDYLLDGCIEKTAALIVRAFRTGTFGKDAETVCLAAPV